MEGNLKDVSQFFHDISPKILKLVSQNYKNSHVLKYKKSNVIDFATETDIEVENLIVSEIKKRFPEDLIIAEENFAKTKISFKERLWIIDPICGTTNFAKGIKFCATNIALAKEGKLVASCVVDHSQNEYIWSIGKHAIFVNQNRFKTNKILAGIDIEVDLTGINKSTQEIKEKYSKFVYKLLTKTNYRAITHATSLGYAYVSLGRVDAYINPDINIWDMAAANFLTQEAGGIVTDIQGLPWTLSSTTVVAARDKSIHKELINLLNP